MFCKVLDSRVSRSIGIIITNQCNAECDFCCNNSGPNQKTRLSLQEVLSIIKQANELGFKQICFTGGEPTILLSDILIAGELITSLGMSMTINSNGLFGKNKSKALKILTSLKKVGLVKVTLSFDDSHAKYIPAISVKNVIQICRDLDISIHLTSAFYTDGNRLNHYFSEQDLLDVIVSENPVQSSGRAQNRHDLYPSGEIPQDLCPSPFNMVVNFDGKIYPCCSVSGFTKSIELGHISNIQLEHAIAKTIENKFLFYIQKRGLSDFFESSIVYNPMIKNAHSVCDLCKIVSENDFFYEKTLKFIDSEFYRFGLETLNKIHDIDQQ
ncbi:radical SAM protein [Acinetobacter indicus]|uniref:radical SAM protein n=1 Tax=Acinetobacter indicus TaxID=756892 RepID=UPI00257502B7|nr:radical SAM protein [Acinetobacter indicus]MDM1300309.1 radical SAM protein [Acinetobacter indicus]